MDVLVVGGSGFLSGTVARVAMAAGHRVWAVTRGQRAMPAGVTPIVADRKDHPAFQAAIEAADARWDLVVDSIGYNAGDAQQDLDCFTDRATQLVFVSTDFTISPFNRPWKIDETYDQFHDSPYGSGKRAAEEVLLSARGGAMAITVIRPGHIYGPGSLLGCIPFAGRDPKLIEKLKRGDTLQLVGGGHFLQQPVFAEDLANMILSVAGNGKAMDDLFFGAGPDVIESWVFYQIIADVLGVKLSLEEVSVQKTLAEKPDLASFFTHRVYDMNKAARAGLKVPQTSIEVGLRKHVESLLS